MEGLNYEVTDIPAEHQERAKAALAELIDAVSNKDDTIANLVLEDKPVDAVALKAAIRRLTCKIELVPVLCRFGLQEKRRSGFWWMPLLIICPARWTFLALKVWSPARKRGSRRNERYNKFCSLAFKLWTDPYAGKLVFSAFMPAI